MFYFLPLLPLVAASQRLSGWVCDVFRRQLEAKPLFQLGNRPWNVIFSRKSPSEINFTSGEKKSRWKNAHHRPWFSRGFFPRGAEKFSRAQLGIHKTPRFLVLSAPFFQGALETWKPAKCLALSHRRKPGNPGGMVLVLVLVVIAVLSLAAYTFAELMLSENKSTRVTGRQVQADALAESGAELLRLYLTQTPEMLQQAGGVYDNPTQFQGLLVADSDMPYSRGRFAVVAPRVENGDITGVRFGAENESARLNLNTLLLADQQAENGARNLLMGLPGMTEEIADAILDWLDEDSESREFGAEMDYYSGLTPAYSPKNGPLNTIEELLLVRGVTPDLLFGADQNRNGLIDPGEMNGPMLSDALAADPEVNRGWSAYLTLHSKEANVRPDGTPRIDLNSSDLQKLYDDLNTVFNAEQASYIVAYRIYGPRNSGNNNSNRNPNSSPSPNPNSGPSPNPNPNPSPNPTPTTIEHRSVPSNIFRLVAFQQTPAPNPNGQSPGGMGPGGQTPGGQTPGGQNPGGRGPGGRGPGGGGPGGGGFGGRGPGGGRNPGQGRDGLGPGGQRPDGEGRGGRGDRGGRGRGRRNQNDGGDDNNQNNVPEVSADSIELDLTQEGRFRFQQVLDLVGSSIEVRPPASSGSSGDSGNTRRRLRNPFPDDPTAAAEFLPLLYDHVTTNPAPTIPGRININEASRIVLLGIPGMSPEVAEQIISTREPEPTGQHPERKYESWLYTEQIVDLQQLKALTPFITSGGNVYRAQIVGYFDKDGPAARIEAIFDATQATNGPARIVFWRNLSHLGRGYPLELLGVGAE